MKIFSHIPDWSHLRERYCKFWQGEIADGAIIAHIQNPAKEPLEPESWMLTPDEDAYLDPTKLFKLKTWQRSRWDWHADLFEYCMPSYGPNVFAGFAAGQPVFGADTVWHEQLIHSLDESERIHFDPDNYYWRKSLETVEHFSTVCEGQMQLGGTDFGGTTDWISTLMGTESFLMATIDEPDRMRELAMRLARECVDAYRIVNPRIMLRNDGSANWMPMWSPGSMFTCQDDMAINFSPEMYKDVFLPALRIMADAAEYTVLHWHDGCSQHLDALLEVEQIDAIQYGHDPNTGSFREQIDALKRIQAAGKKLFISCVDTEDVEFFISQLDPHGLAMIINCKDVEESRMMQECVRIYTGNRLIMMKEKGTLREESAKQRSDNQQDYCR